MAPGFFPDANKITKYQESRNYWMFKTGKRIYKVKKQEDAKSTVSLEEIFCRETVRRMKEFSPGLQVELAAIRKDGQGFRLDNNTDSDGSLYFVIVMNQLSNRYFLDQLIIKKKLNEKAMARIGCFLLQLHERAARSSGKQEGSAEALTVKLNDLIYQSKKYLGDTITQPMIDMTLHPVEKHISDNRKLLQRRIRNGRIREIHGCFIPRKIHVTKDEVLALARTSDPLRDRFNDIAMDLAALSVELNHEENQPMAGHLVDVYCQHTDDADIRTVLPIYQALHSLSQGLQYSIGCNQHDAESAARTRAKATAYYEQAIEITQQI